ncbi:MAG TPA: hypothetical protein EYP61_07950 [Candidatus Latescibacteria bacterium]|nr:hypothetical protein [Candidatus Latescibacterota bacterium]
MSETFDRSREFEAIVEAYERGGGDPSVLLDRRFASFVVSGNRILSSNSVPGVVLEGQETETGVRAYVKVEPGTKVPFPVHLCFGMLPREGLQEITSEFEIGEGANVKFLAHCSFPNAANVRHIMDSRVHVGHDAEMEYSETHFHGRRGGTEVVPRTEVQVEAGGRFRNQFKLITGRVGKLNIELNSELKEGAVCDLEVKVYGRGDDEIRVRESVYLNGTGSRGLVRSRIVVTEEAQSEVLGEIVGNAPFTRGHVDCVEIVQGERAKAKALPLLQVLDPTAKLTHEAAIGSVDKRQVQTLMARGLSEEEAVEVIVRGLLK